MSRGWEISFGTVSKAFSSCRDICTMRQISYADRYGYRFEYSGFPVSGLRSRRQSWGYGGWILATSLVLCSAANRHKCADRLMFQHFVKTRGLKGLVNSSSRTLLTPCSTTNIRCAPISLLHRPSLFSKSCTMDNWCSSIVIGHSSIDSLLRGAIPRTSGTSSLSMANDAASDATDDADWARWKTRCRPKMSLPFACAAAQRLHSTGFSMLPALSNHCRELEGAVQCALSSTRLL